MNINFDDYDFEGFKVQEGVFCGIPAKLITPNDITVKFNQNNKIFRSSIWGLDGKLLSASFPKFVNFGESPTSFPIPESLDGATVVEKVDGSTAIFDLVNGQLNARTRGKFSHHGLQNEGDFDFVIRKYPIIYDILEQDPQISLIFEITTPNQQIVINYGAEPDLWLIGAIDKKDYRLCTQEGLDVVSSWNSFKRPKSFKFDSIPSLLEEIREKKEGEGVCVYTSSDQVIHKVKSARYLMLQKLKSEISSFEKVLDLFFELGKPTVAAFYDHILSHFDYELAELAMPQIELCVTKWTALEEELDELREWVKTLAGLSRKDAAAKIVGYTKLTAEAFLFLDNKEPEEKRLKKIILT